eukprot:6201219-Pleurochrysis_carterae.AAC.2
MDVPTPMSMMRFSSAFIGALSGQWATPFSRQIRARGKSRLPMLAFAHLKCALRSSAEWGNCSAVVRRGWKRSEGKKMQRGWSKRATVVEGRGADGNGEKKTSRERKK